MRQFILHLNDQKIADKKFILENIDANHLLIKSEAREEIARKAEEWMDMVCQIFITLLCAKLRLNCTANSLLCEECSNKCDLSDPFPRTSILPSRGWAKTWIHPSKLSMCGTTSSCKIITSDVWYIKRKLRSMDWCVHHPTAVLSD